MKYKVGDRVKVKSLDWYNENKIEEGIIECGGFTFLPQMTEICGKIVTIERVYDICYDIKKFPYALTDAMIEGLAKEESINKKALKQDGFPTSVKANTILVNTDLCEDEVEIVISADYELKQANGRWIAVKKIPKCPTNYEECCKVLGVSKGFSIVMNENISLYHSFIKLKRCRDAYWKIAGDWKPGCKKGSDSYNLIVYEGDVIKDFNCGVNRILSFPTSEMRDVFYENFKDLINECKELL